MIASKTKSLSNLFRFAFKYRQNSASCTANLAGISYRTAEISRSFHTYPFGKREEPKIESEKWNQATETLRRLGVKVSVENCKSVAKETIDFYVGSDDVSHFSCGKRYCIVSGEAREQMLNAFQFMKKQGLFTEEEVYSTALCYLISHNLEEESKFLFGKIKEEVPDDSLPRLGYFEMLLWIKFKHNQKIEEIGNRIIDRWDKLSRLEVNYLEAFCVTFQYEYLQRLLRTVDITKASSLDQLTPIFEYLGQSNLMFDAKRLLGELKGTAWAEHISHLIFSYATSVVVCQDIRANEKFWLLHTEVGVKPSFELFEKLIEFECRSRLSCHQEGYDYKVPIAAKIVDEMRENGFIENSEEGQYFYDIIERIYGIDWLRATENVINDMGSTKFQLNKFLSMFSDKMFKSS